MKNKVLITIGIVIGIMLLSFGIWFLFIDKNIYINLEGDKIVNIDVLSEYEDAGAKVYYKPRLLNGKKIDNLIIENNVDTSKTGKYKVYYSVEYNDKKKRI